MQTTLGRHAQRSLLEQLATVSAKERADGASGVGTADGQFLAHFPPKFPGSGASAGRKYTALRSSVASKTAKVEALKRRSKQLKALARIGTAFATAPLPCMSPACRRPDPRICRYPRCGTPRGARSIEAHLRGLSSLVPSPPGRRGLR